MKSFIQFLAILIVIVAACIIAFTWGKRKGMAESETSLIENYAFVRDIAELASVEVDGVSTFKSTNVSQDGAGITGSLKRLLMEQTVTLSAPFTAKFGVDLSDSTLRMVRRDSLLEIHLPQPKLLSYELHLDRLQTSNKQGWFQFQNNNLNTEFQKKLYSQGKAQLQNNGIYLSRSRDRICGILQRYFQPLGVQAVCVFDGEVRGLKG